MLHCKHCKEEGAVISERHGSPRKCGFDDNGFFTGDNYCCVTLSRLNEALRANADISNHTKVVFVADEWLITHGLMGYDDITGPDNQTYTPIGVILHQYKSRGRITGAWVVVDGGHPPIPLTEAIATTILQDFS